MPGGGLADSALRRSRFASAREEPRKGEPQPGRRCGEVRLAREGAAGRLASPGAALAHRAGRPRRDLLMSREASSGLLPAACPAGTARRPDAATWSLRAATWATRGRAGSGAGGHAHLNLTSAAFTLGARPRHAPALTPPANLASPLTLCDVAGAGCRFGGGAWRSRSGCCRAVGLRR